MKNALTILILIVSILFTSCKEDHPNLSDGLYAEIETTKGTIVVALDYSKAPITVANFVSLAEGKNTFVSADFKGKPFFNGLKFHRVIPNFMIQTGDPLGNGSGDCGYKFKDEFSDLKHNKAGVLSMANSGPGTNSSQFFITHLETPWLDGKHTVFGNIVDKGMEVVNAIVQDDVIKTVVIIRKGEDAKKFDAVKVFSDYFKVEADNQKKRIEDEAKNKLIYDEKYKVVKAQKIAMFTSAKASGIKSTSGLVYKIIQKGSSKKPEKGTNVFIEYAGFLEDGTLFDTSNAKVADAFGKLDTQRLSQNGYAPMPFQMGANNMIPGFIEGLEKLNFGDKAILFIPSKLAYGEQGAGGIIPPNATIVFEVQIVEKQ